jgi:hypothetical protein
MSFSPSSVAIITLTLATGAGLFATIGPAWGQDSSNSGRMPASGNPPVICVNEESARATGVRGPQVSRTHPSATPR